MESEYDLIHTMKELAAMKKQYVKVQSALEAVRDTGYGVVVPELAKSSIEDPSSDPTGQQIRRKNQVKKPIHPYDQSKN